MKRARFLKAMVAVGVVAACGGVLSSCGNAGDAASNAVAATVNGTEISEAHVTELIQNVREQSGVTDEADWANFLIENDMTPESVREQIIDSLVDQELIKTGAASLDITVDSSEIDGYVDEMREKFDSDEAWQDALEKAGFTEEEYRENIQNSLLSQKVSEHFRDTAELSDDELLEQAQSYASYYDGAKRSSHILFKVEDTTDEAAMDEARQKAQEVLDKINSGEIDFADAAKEYSEDSSASDGGDVGWDVLNSFVTEYTDALDSLGKDEVSGLVESQFGVHIIKCTDVFEAPEKLKKFTDLPEAFQTTISDMAKSIKSNEDYQAWVDEQHDSADLQVNDMPADAPYNVDLTKYQTDDAEASDEAADADGDDADDDGDEGEVIELDEEGDVSGDVADADESGDAAEASDDAAEADAEASDEAADAE